MSSTKAAGGQRGFTLIEVMLAFALLGLMLLILYSSFALGSRAEERVRARIRANEKIRSVEGLLAGYIRSAYPYRSSQRGVGVVFSGKEDELSFISALSVLSGERGLANVTLSVQRDEEGGILTLRESLPVRLGGGVNEEESLGDTDEVRELQSGGSAVGTVASGGNAEAAITNEVVLAEKLTRASISYLEVTEENEEWFSEWDGVQRERLPKAVRIILEAEDAEPVEWVFPIMIRVLTV